MLIESLLCAIHKGFCDGRETDVVTGIKLVRDSGRWVDSFKLVFDSGTVMQDDTKPCLGDKEENVGN